LDEKPLDGLTLKKSITQSEQYFSPAFEDKAKTFKSLGKQTLTVIKSWFQ